MFLYGVMWGYTGVIWGHTGRMYKKMESTIAYTDTYCGSVGNRGRLYLGPRQGLDSLTPH